MRWSPRFGGVCSYFFPSGSQFRIGVIGAAAAAPTVVTRNVRGFEPTGVPLIYPWVAE
jgi:hypothetical protein